MARTQAPPRPSPAQTPSQSARAVVRVRKLFASETPEYVVMVAMVLFLVIFGLVMVLSSSFVTARQGDGSVLGVWARQGMWAMLGLPLMFILSTWRIQAWRALAPTLLLISLILQGLVVFTPLGVTSGGNTNWLSLGGVTGQPSEFLKLALIVWMAHVLADRVEYITEPGALKAPLLPGMGLALAFVLFGQDLGTMGVMALIVLGILFVAGIRLSLLGGAVGLVAAVAAVDTLEQ